MERERGRDREGEIDGRMDMFIASVPGMRSSCCDDRRHMLR